MLAELGCLVGETCSSGEQLAWIDVPGHVGDPPAGQYRIYGLKRAVIESKKPKWVSDEI